MVALAKNSLSGIVVAEAMRRRLNCLNSNATISHAITFLVKYKINGLPVTDQNGQIIGVVSKTDIMGAYYAGLPLDSPIEYVMSSPPLFCDMNTPLEHALEKMRDSGVYRLLVRDTDSDATVGALAYPDIVGMLYKYCHDCEYSHFNKKGPGRKDQERLLIKDCMSGQIRSVHEASTLEQVMEELSQHNMGALLLTDNDGKGSGVISKTDLILAYNHELPADTPATSVMSSPVKGCAQNDLLEDGIRIMIFSDVHRLFVVDDDPENVIGVFSLADAARSRSGSCHACISSRIEIA